MEILETHLIIDILGAECLFTKGIAIPGNYPSITPNLALYLLFPSCETAQSQFTIEITRKAVPRVNKGFYLFPA